MASAPLFQKPAPWIRILCDMRPPAGTSHAVQAGVPPENVLALIEAYHEFGAYGM
jgi:hypothetical protein